MNHSPQSRFTNCIHRLKFSCTSADCDAQPISYSFATVLRGIERIYQFIVGPNSTGNSSCCSVSRSHRANRLVRYPFWKNYLDDSWKRLLLLEDLVTVCQKF